MAIGNIKYGILIAICLGFNAAIAQEELPSEQVEVVKNFNARLIESQKVKFNPTPVAVDSTRKTYDYTLSQDIPEVSYEVPSIRPLALKNDQKPKYYRGYARAGYGVPNQILGDAFYQLVENETLQLGASASHHSANNKDFANQRFMDNDGRVTATWFATDQIAVDGEIGYSFDDYYYYAEDPNDPTPDFDRRRYKIFDAKAGASNSVIFDNGLSYKGTFEFINIQDDQGAKENNMILDLTGGKKFNEQHSVGLNLIADWSTLNDIDSRSLNNYLATPTYTYSGRRFRATGGVTVAFDSEDFYFYPAVDASVQVIDEALVVNFNAEGGLRKNNFYNLATYNPYINQRIDTIRNTRNTSFTLGAGGSYGMFSYDAGVTYSIVKEQALFLPERNDARTFQPIYDDVNTVTAQASFGVSPWPRFESGITLTKNFYSTDLELEAWHLPGFEGRLYGKYKMLDNKLNVRLDFFHLSGIKYIRDDKQTDTLKPIYDVSVQADWFFSERFGVFAQINNIAGNNGERWQRYPTFGFNAVGGIMVRF